MKNLVEALNKIEPKEIKEYLDLFRRHYELDELWPDNVKECPPDASRLFDLESKFRGTDITRILLNDLEKVLAVARELAKALNKTPHTNNCEYWNGCSCEKNIEQDCLKILEGDE